MISRNTENLSKVHRIRVTVTGSNPVVMESGPDNGIGRLSRETEGLEIKEDK